MTGAVPVFTARNQKLDGGPKMRRVGLVWLCGVSILAMAVMGVGSAVAADQHDHDGWHPRPSGTSTNGNAEGGEGRARTIRSPAPRDPGLTRGVTSSSREGGLLPHPAGVLAARTTASRHASSGRTPTRSSRAVARSTSRRARTTATTRRPTCRSSRSSSSRTGDFAIVGISPNVLTASAPTS